MQSEKKEVEPDLQDEYVLILFRKGGKREGEERRKKRGGEKSEEVKGQSKKREFGWRPH